MDDLKELRKRHAEAADATHHLKSKIDEEKYAARAAVDAKYVDELSMLQTAENNLWKQIDAIEKDEALAHGLARLPLPEGTVVDEWTNLETRRLGPWKEIEPKKTGRSGMVKLFRPEDNHLKRLEYASGLVGAPIVVLHKNDGTLGKQFVNFSGFSDSKRWIERGKGWDDYQPLKSLDLGMEEDDEEAEDGD